ncbi:hypothetical protein O3P69_017707 [Scylla paramamosain]|uniref:CCHC-type domain-containing protein n=1 Tax=Scylla paramamosain TaxID=85552 RepID=A0AAW0TYE5_SCYPA
MRLLSGLGVLAANRPTLPAYKDEEDIAVYLVWFERVAKLLELKEDSYAGGCLLTGKATELYTSLLFSVIERRTTSLSEAIQLADNWATAHNAYLRASSSQHRKPPQRADASQKPQVPPTGRKAPTSVKCYNCGEQGYIRPNCTKKPRSFKDLASSSGAFKIKVADYLGRTDEFPLVQCFLRCPYYSGWVNAARHRSNSLPYWLITFLKP